MKIFILTSYIAWKADNKRDQIVSGTFFHWQQFLVDDVFLLMEKKKINCPPLANVICLTELDYLSERKEKNCRIFLWTDTFLQYLV